MNCMLVCEVTMSKKLEKFCEEGEPVSIHVDSIKGNKGRAMIRMVVKNGSDLAEMAKIGETSLILKVLNAEEDVPSLETGRSGVSMFSGVGRVDGSTATEKAVLSHATPNSKLGDPHPMHKQIAKQEATAKAEVREALRQQTAPSKPQTAAPRAAPQAPEPLPENTAPETVEDDNSILTYDDLMSELEGVRNIDKEIEMPKQLSGDKVGRQAAIKIAESIPRMSRHVYVRNLMKNCLIIQDIQLNSQSCLSFQPGEVCDMSRFPAKLIRDSNDLKWCMETGKITFVTRADFVKYIESISGLTSDSRGLQVYGSRGEAASKMKTTEDASVVVDKAEMEVLDKDGDIPFGDDHQLDKLVRSMPQ